MNKSPRPVVDFITYMRVIKNRTAQTTAKYEHDLCMFLRHVAATREGLKAGTEEYQNYDISGIDIDFIKTITSNDVLSFLYHKKSDDHNESHAIARRLSSIKSFFKYFTVSKHILEENPAANIETPPQKNTLPRFLSLDESLALINAVNSDTESKERTVYLNDSCKNALKAYIHVRALDTEIKPEDSRALFISSHHRRISNTMVQKIVYKYLSAAGLSGGHYSVHKLRHTAATLMYRSGEVDVRVLKDILGHEQLNTTQIYTHVSNKQLEKAMDANPLSQIGVTNSGNTSKNK